MAESLGALAPCLLVYLMLRIPRTDSVTLKLYTRSVEGENFKLGRIQNFENLQPAAVEICLDTGHLSYIMDSA